MYVNFEKELKDNSQKIPSPLVLDHLISKALPTDVRYKVDSDGNLSMSSDKGTFALGGLKPEITNEWKEIIGQNQQIDRVMDYAYRVQEPVRLNLNYADKILVNGEEISIECIEPNIFDKFDNADHKKNVVYAYPPKFPEPKKINISGNGYNDTLSLHRIPFKSLEEIALESDREGVLQMSCRINEQDNTTKITFSINFKKARTIKEIVKAISIYNAIADGTGMINEKLIPNNGGNECIKKVGKQTEIFWKETFDVENAINNKYEVHFDPQCVEFDESTVYMVEELFQCLVHERPVRSQKTPDYVRGKITDIGIPDISKLFEKELYSEYESRKTIHLFGTDITIVSLNGILNGVVSDYTLDGEQVTISFLRNNENSNGNQSYTSTMDFLDEGSLNFFKEKDALTRKKFFSDAKTIEEYIEENKEIEKNSEIV